MRMYICLSNEGKARHLEQRSKRPYLRINISYTLACPFEWQIHNIAQCSNRSSHPPSFDFRLKRSLMSRGWTVFPETRLKLDVTAATFTGEMTVAR